MGPHRPCGARARAPGQAPATGVQVCIEQPVGPIRVVQVHRRRRARVDLENGRTIVVQQKVDAVAADQSGVLDERLQRIAKGAGHRSRNADWTHGSCVGVSPIADASRQLARNADHLGAPAIGQKQQRQVPTRCAALEISVPRGRIAVHQRGVDHVRAPGRAAPLEQPAATPLGPRQHGRRMRNAQPVQQAEEFGRILQTRDQLGRIAEQLAASGQQRQRLGVVLEAGPVDQSEAS